jgi:hypothetical protein
VPWHGGSLGPGMKMTSEQKQKLHTLRLNQDASPLREELEQRAALEEVEQLVRERSLNQSTSAKPISE